MEKIRKPRVLLTGFTPFGGETVNPALETVKRVRCPEAEVRVLEVPTVFGESSRVVTAAMDAFRPDVVLCVGQAAGRSAVTPERVAINVDDARIPDNAGQQPADAPIVPGGPAAYFATVPVKDTWSWPSGRPGCRRSCPTARGHMCATTCCTAYCTMQVRESGRDSSMCPASRSRRRAPIAPPCPWRSWSPPWRRRLRPAVKDNRFPPVKHKASPGKCCSTDK